MKPRLNKKSMLLSFASLCAILIIALILIRRPEEKDTPRVITTVVEPVWELPTVSCDAYTPHLLWNPTGTQIFINCLPYNPEDDYENYWRFIGTIWDVQSKQEVQRLTRGTERGTTEGADFRGARWSSDGNRLVAWAGQTIGERGEIHIWDTRSGELLQYWFEPEAQVNGAIWNHQEDHILYWMSNGNIKIRHATTGHTLLELDYLLPLTGGHYNQDESEVLFWDTAGAIRVWDLLTGEEKFTLRHDNSPIVGAMWNADERRILSWSWDKTARVWDAENGTELFRLTHQGIVIGAFWRHGGDEFFTWSRDGNVGWWSAEDGSPIHTFSHEGGVVGARLSQNETQLLTWSADATVKIWDLSTGLEAINLQHESPLIGATWSHKEQFVVTWAQDKWVRVWDATNGELIHDFRQGGGQIIGAALNIDDTYLAVWSEFHDIAIWDLP
jgi:WD40 repeat protein